MKPSNRIMSLNGPPGTDDGWSVLYRARAMMAKGRDVINLSIGDHDTPTPGIIVEATQQALARGHTGYAAVNGEKRLRAAIAARFAERTGIATGDANVFVSSGGQGALFAALMGATEPGDKTVIIDPYYATYPATVRATGGTPVILKANPDNGFQLDRDALMSATEGAAALLINSPNNPTGAVYGQATLNAIREACMTHDLWCLSDEVYDSQVHSGHHISPRQLPDMAERSLVIGSLSKSHVMTGFRLGWLVGPAPFIAPLTDLTNATTYGAPGFIQDAAITALTGAGDAEVATSRLYTRRRNRALDALKGVNSLRISPPDGAMYVMLDIRRTGLSGLDFANRLLDSHAIAVMPGESFGTAAAGHIRVALTVPDDVLADALATIARFAGRQQDSTP